MRLSSDSQLLGNDEPLGLVLYLATVGQLVVYQFQPLSSRDSLTVLTCVSCFGPWASLWSQNVSEPLGPDQLSYLSAQE